MWGMACFGLCPFFWGVLLVVWGWLGPLARCLWLFDWLSGWAPGGQGRFGGRPKARPSWPRALGGDILSPHTPETPLAPGHPPHAITPPERKEKSAPIRPLATFPRLRGKAHPTDRRQRIESRFSTYRRKQP